MGAFSESGTSNEAVSPTLHLGMSPPPQTLHFTDRKVQGEGYHKPKHT